MTASQKTKRRSTVEAVDIAKMYGQNPIYDPKVITEDNFNIEFGRALNWCNRALDHKQLREELANWMELNGYDKKSIRLINHPADYYGTTAGKVAYLANNNWPLPEKSIFYLKEKISELSSQAEKIIKEKKENKEEVKETKSDPINKNFSLAQEIYDEIQDDIINYQRFSTEKYGGILKGKTNAVLNNILDMLKNLNDEIQLIGSDTQVTESYSFLNKRNTTKVKKLFDESIKLVEGETLNKKLTRRTRTKKPKSAGIQVKSLKYKKHDKTNNLVSVDPTTIIGKKKLIVYNTKQRKIGVYHSKTDEGFSVKGTTIQNFDVNTSKQKMLRSTKKVTIDDHLANFKKSTVKKVDKVFDDLTTVDTRLNGRISEDIILLKVYK